MRVGLLIYGSLDTMSGGFLYDRKLVEALRHAGDEVETISIPWRTYASHLTDNLNAELVRRLRDLEVDVLLQDELNHPSLFWTIRRLRPHRYPMIAIVHHLRSSEPHIERGAGIQREVEQIYLRNVDGFVFNSQTTAASVRRLLTYRSPGYWLGFGARAMARAALRQRSWARTFFPNALANSIVAYPAGNRFNPTITREEIAARARRPGPLKFVFVGNVIPRKGLHTLIDALSQLPRSSWQLDIVGSMNVDPDYSRRIRQQISLLGLAGQVKSMGALSDVALAALLAQSQVLAVPSSYEGFGIVYLEGMGFGLPAVATTAGAASEIITDERDGILAPPDNADELARRLNRLCQDRDLVAQMSLEARQHYLAHPTWDDSMARVRAKLEQIVRDWPAPLKA